MFKIEKNEPEFFLSAKKNLPLQSDSWGNSQIQHIRADLANFILKEQFNLCIYCEKYVANYPNDCHIDHFKKRSLFPNKTLDYNNLLVSCNKGNRCAKYKDKKINNHEDYEKIINPVIENPENFLEYTLFGEIIPKDSLSIEDNQKAEFTIKIFNLNDKGLVEERKNVIKSLCYMIEYITNLDDIIANGFKQFITLCKWFLIQKEQIINNKMICNEL